MICSEDAAKAWLRGLPECTSEAMARLDCLVAMLSEENARQNLVSALSLGEVWRRHIADSAQLLAHVPRGTCSPWLDLGSGAGFPGLVIAALRPECEMLLVESRSLRAQWLEKARSALGLGRLAILGRRLEQVVSEPVRVISARAFAPLESLLQISARFSTSDTLWLLPKGRSARDELSALRGWDHLFHVEQSLTDAQSGVIVGKLAGRKGQKP